jgi:hypothetical protein
LKRVDAAKAAFYPSFDIKAFFGFNALNLSQLFLHASQQINIAPGLYLPVFDSGRLNASLGGERAEQRADSPSSPASAAIEAERRQITVMFIDLVDSTAPAERFDPEDMRRLLGGYHQACAGQSKLVKIGGAQTSTGLRS